MMTVLQNIWIMIWLAALVLLACMAIYGWTERKVKRYLNKRKPD